MIQDDLTVAEVVKVTVPPQSLRHYCLLLATIELFEHIFCAGLKRK